MGVKIIRLERVQSREAMSTEPPQSYVFHANLSQDGELRIDGYSAVSRLCRVIGSAPKCGRHDGFHVLTSDGWVLSGGSCEGRLQTKALDHGTYVNISEDDGRSDLFRVASVEDACVEVVRV